jgi:hypothetical protein
MRTRLVGAVAAVAIALGALAIPSAGPVQAGSTCTGWSSSLRPPTSIRVYRTALGRTVTVPFRTYVEKVMAAEWGTSHPADALRVGAVAVKQYAWYFTIHWRGGRDAAGRCYDVVDTTRDQLYNPGRTVPASHRAAVAATWNVSLRKGSRFFLTGYRAGTGSCTANIDGWKLYQRDASDCVRRHRDTAEKLARRFFSGVSWITPGAGDLSGDGRGDVAVTITDPATGATTARVYTADSAYATAVANGSLAGDVLTAAAPESVLGRAAGDVTGDGRRDLVQLVDTPDGLALQVIRATSSGLAPAVTWWTDAADPASPGAGGDVRLLVADFTGDGRDDAAIVRIMEGEAPSAAVFLAASSGKSFAAVRRTWSAGVDLAPAELHAGDVNGDGLADLVAASPTSAGGTALRVARSTSRRVLGSLATWGTDALPPSSLRTMVGDVNRDGRSDVIVARRDGDGMRIVAYRAPTSGTTFRRAALTGTLDLPFDATRLSSADLSGDGRADVVALVDRGDAEDGTSLGTAVWRLLSNNEGTLALRSWTSSANVDWATAVPY